MVDESKCSIYEGADVWSYTDEIDSIWKKSIVKDIGHIGELGGKVEVHVDVLDGEREIIKTKYEDDEIHEFQHIKPRSNSHFNRITDIDLPALPIINEPEIVECLRHCFAENVRYLSVGPVLLSINRHEVIPSVVNEKMYKNYFLVDKARQDIVNPIRADIIKMAYEKYLKLHPSNVSFRSSGNQAVIMLGESGGGKSRCTRELCSHIAFIAAKLQRRLDTDTSFTPDIKFFDHVHTILESFGHAQTVSNITSSRFSKAIKITFSEKTGAIKGVIFRCFHLEMDRTTIQRPGESNYNVFFDVFDDIYFAAQAMSKYGIDNLTTFRYAMTRPKTVFRPGKSSYKDLAAALDSIAKINKAKQNSSIFAVLAGILHLGQIELEEVDNYGDVSTVFSSDPASVDHMNRVFKLLGITLESLLAVVAKRSLNFAGNIVEKNLDLAESLVARDAFASQLYISLFRWVVSKVNAGIAELFCAANAEGTPTKSDTTLSDQGNVFDCSPATPIAQNQFNIYDFTGFECFDRNSLEQLCVNYSNERLFQFLNQMVFVLDKEFFYSESVNVGIVNFFDNALTIRLLDNKSNGIFTICDDQLKLKSSTSDEKLASILYTQHSNNKMFIAGRNEQKKYEFLIQHYVSSVRYDINGFTNSNKVEPAMEILECLRSSTLSFVQEELAMFCDVRTLSNQTHSSGLTPPPSLDLSPSRASFGAGRTPSSRNLLGGHSRSPSLRNVMQERSPSLRGHSFEMAASSTPPTQNRRDSFLRSRSAHPSLLQDSPSPLPSRPGMGARSSSVMNRGGVKVCTLTSLFSLQMAEILAEAKTSDTSFMLCIKPNDSQNPILFDQKIVLRQIRPFGLDSILTFYKKTYPYRADSVSWINRYSPIAVLAKKSNQLTSQFLTALWDYRSHGLDNPSLKEWNEVATSLVQLLPYLPELKAQCANVKGVQESVGYSMDDIISGIYVGNNCVMMTAVAYFYLNAAQQLAVKLIGCRILHFYRRLRDGAIRAAAIRLQCLVRCFIAKLRVINLRKRRGAATRIQSLMRGFLVRLERIRESQNARDEFIFSRVAKLQALWRGRSVRNRCAIATRPESSRDSCGSFGTTNSNRMDEGNIDIDIDSLREDSEENVGGCDHDDGVSLDPIQITGSITASEKPKMLTADTLHVHQSNIEKSDNNVTSIPQEDITVKGCTTIVSQHSLGSETRRASFNPLAAPVNRIHHTKITELQATIQALEAENSRLKRKLETVESPGSHDQDYEEREPERNMGPYRKVLSKRQSTVDEFSRESVYGGEYASPYTLQKVQSRSKEYEMYVSSTLKAIEDDISYLLKPTPFYKFGRNGSVRKTVIVITPDFHYLQWKPKNILKPSSDCQVDLRLVWRLVAGQSTPPFDAYKGVSHGPMPPSRSFSLVYGFRSLDLCATDDDSFEDWFTGLRFILQLINADIQEAGLDRQLLRKKWNFLDTKHRGFLSRREVIELVSNLGIQFDRASFTSALLRSTIGNSTHDEITFSQFDSLVYQLRRRPDLEIVWNKIRAGHDFTSDIFPLEVDDEFDTSVLHEVIGVPTFQHFWEVSQGRKLTVEEAHKMISEGMGEMHCEDFPVLSYNGFVNIMTSQKNDGFDPMQSLLSNEDMSHPLQHYYISTSEGLTGDTPYRQMGENSLLEEDYRPNCYSTAIEQGCRALELRIFEDRIHPDGEQTELYVGSSRGKERALFKETLLFIQRVAFVYSKFPLILMIEVSCGIAQQKRAARLLKKVFGDAIFTPSEVQNQLLPSPAELSNRVIMFLTHRKKDIHTAYRVDNSETAAAPSPYESFVLNGNRMVDRVAPYNGDKEEKAAEYDSERDFALNTKLNTVEENSQNSSVPRNYSIVDVESTLRPGHRRHSGIGDNARGIHPNLMRLLHYSHGMRVGCHSLRDMLARIAEYPDAEESLVKFNMKKFCFIYMDSNTKKFGSYGSMVTAWDSGISFLSLCHQYPSLGTKINHGRFRMNGGCGYVLKPIALRTLRECQPSMPYVLTLHIISGHELPVTSSLTALASHMHDTPSKMMTNPLLQSKSMSMNYDDGRFSDDDSHHPVNSVRESEFDSHCRHRKPRNKGFYVVVDLNGTPCDEVQQKTRCIKKHGRNPFWNEVFSFALKDKTQGQLTLRVFSNDECKAFVSIPVTCLRQGFRNLTLFEELEEKNFAAQKLPHSGLFVRVKFDTASDFNAIQQDDHAATLEKLNMLENGDIIQHGMGHTVHKDVEAPESVDPREMSPGLLSSSEKKHDYSDKGQLSFDSDRYIRRSSSRTRDRDYGRRHSSSRELRRRSSSHYDDDRHHRRSSHRSSSRDLHRRSSSGAHGHHRSSRDLHRRSSRDSYHRSSSGHHRHHRSSHHDLHRRSSHDEYRRSRSSSHRDRHRRSSSRDLHRRSSHDEYRRSRSSDGFRRRSSSLHRLESSSSRHHRSSRRHSTRRLEERYRRVSSLESVDESAVDEIIETIANSQKQLSEEHNRVHEEESLDYDDEGEERVEDREELPNYTSAVDMKQRYLEELQEAARRTESKNIGEARSQNRVVKDIVYESDDNVDNGEFNDDPWSPPV